MAQCLQQLLDSSDLPGYFQAQLEEELKQLCSALKAPTAAAVQSACDAYHRQGLDQRGWLLERYDEWLNNDRGSRLLLMLAPRHGGKSIFAAMLAAERKNSVQVGWQLMGSTCKAWNCLKPTSHNVLETGVLMIHAGRSFTRLANY